MSSPIVIYDGSCDFCSNCITWLNRRLNVDAKPFQAIALEKYSLTLKECQHQVVVIDDGIKYLAADGVIYLLSKRGNTTVARLLTLLGPITNRGYFWIARNRGSILVKLVNQILKRLI